MLGDKIVLVLYWTSGDEEHSVLDGTRGDEDNSMLGGTCSSKDNSVLCRTSRGRRGLWVGFRVGSATAVSQSISHSSSSNFTNIPTGSDVLAGLHTWSAGTSGSGMKSMAGISWHSQSAVGSDSLSAVGVDAGSGSGEVTDVMWGWTLEMEYSSTLPTVKEDPSINP